LSGQNDLLQPIANKKRAQERLNRGIFIVRRGFHAIQRAQLRSKKRAKGGINYTIRSFLKERDLGRDTSYFIFPFIGRKKRKRLSLVIKVHLPRRHGGIS